MISIIEKFDMRKNGTMPIYQHLAEHIIAKINDGKLNAGDKLPTEHSLANQLGINRLTVRKSYQLLENQSLVERRRGMGTFISAPKKAEENISKDNVIYILVPHPGHITLQAESSIIERRIVYGVTMKYKKGFIQVVPVSKRLEKLNKIDWDSIRQIPKGAKVFVPGMWFKTLFPFLIERETKIVYLNSQDQYTAAHSKSYKEMYKYGWKIITVDRVQLARNAVEYLYSLGRRKIVFIKHYKDEPLHPFKTGMLQAYDELGIKYKEDFYVEIDRHISKFELSKTIYNLWKKIKFDAVISGCSEITKPIYDSICNKLKLKIPDDVALISYADNPSFLNYEVPISSISFPFGDIGKAAVDYFEASSPNAGELIFQSSIIERESTRKGAGAFVNFNLMPELPVKSNASSYQIAT